MKEPDKTRGLHLENGWNASLDLLSSPSADLLSGENLFPLGSFDTITGFWQFWNNLSNSDDLFSRCPATCSVGLVKKQFNLNLGSYPNASGGEWRIDVKKPEALRFLWMELAMAVVGECFHPNDKLCGLIFTRHAGKSASIALRHAGPLDESARASMGAKLERFLNRAESSPAVYVGGAQRLTEGKLTAQKPTDEELKLSKEEKSSNVLKYDAEFLRRYAVSNNWDQVPADLAAVPWDKIRTQANMLSGVQQGSPAKANGMGAKAMQEEMLRVENPESSLSTPAELVPLSLDGGSVTTVKPTVTVAPSGGFDLESLGGDPVAILKAVEVVLATYKQDYVIEVAESFTSTIVKILDAEGCPKCLRGVDDYMGPFVILRCKLLQCPHVLHVQCVLKNESARESDALIVEPSLKRYHCTSFFRVMPVSVDDLDSKWLQPAAEAGGVRRNCTIELEISHLLSNATALRIDWPHTFSTALDRRTGKDVLLLTLQSPEDDGREAGRASSMNDPENIDEQPVFRARRGRIIFKCTDIASNQSWQHDSNYDLTKVVKTGTTFKLVFLDPTSRNTLSIGIKLKLPPPVVSRPRSDSISQIPISSPDAISLTYVRYEFSSSARQSITSPMLPSLMVNMQPPGTAAYGAPPMSPMSPGLSPMMPGAMSPIMLGRSRVNSNVPGMFPVPPSPVGPHLMSPTFQDPYRMYGDNMSGPIVNNPGQFPNGEAANINGGSGGKPMRYAFDQDVARSGAAQSVSNIPVSGSEDNMPKSEGGARGLHGQKMGGALPFPGSDSSSGGPESQGEWTDMRIQWMNFPSMGNLLNSLPSDDSRAISPGSLETSASYLSQAVGQEISAANQMSSANGVAVNGSAMQASTAAMLEAAAQASASGDTQTAEMLYAQLNTTDASMMSNLPLGTVLPDGSLSPGNQLSGLGMMGPTIMDHVVGRVFMLSKSQSGSRFVQEKLSDPVYFVVFFNELKTRVAELMMDNFGHYAIEALLNHCNDEQRLVLLMNLARSIGAVACHKQGSFSIQAMMDCLRSQTQIGLLCDALNNDIQRIILNSSGHYVILRFLQRFGYPYTKFVHRAIIAHTSEFATDHYGLRVLKAVVDAGPVSEMQEVFAALVKQTNMLVENQYGNYIIQHLLDVAPKQVATQIKQKMNGKYVRFSKQKFSSNVVEKCLRHSTREWRYNIMRQLIASAGELISDKYGNYCLQTVLHVADRQMVDEFTQAVSPHLEHLRENVKSKWKKLLEQANKKYVHIPYDGTPPQSAGTPDSMSSGKMPMGSGQIQRIHMTRSAAVN
eukprot:248560_1